MSLLPGRRCLGDEISEYAAGRLDPRSARQYDLHLVACESCRCAVDQERRLQSAFASGMPAVPAGLRSSLLSLASSVASASTDPRAATGSPGSTGGAGRTGSLPGAQPRDGVPPVPQAPAGFRVATFGGAALPVVAPGAPALHRSALRSAVIATAVAGASAAAALGLGMTTSQTVSSGTARQAPPVLTSAPAGAPAGAQGGSGAGAQPAGVTTAVTYRRPVPQPAMFSIAPLGAQSTP